MLVEIVAFVQDFVLNADFENDKRCGAPRGGSVRIGHLSDRSQTCFCEIRSFPEVVDGRMFFPY